MEPLERTKRRAYLVVYAVSLSTIGLAWVLRAELDRFVRFGFPALAGALVVTFVLLYARRIPLTVLERAFYAFLATWGLAYLLHTLYGLVDPLASRQELLEGVFPVLLTLCVLAHVFFQSWRATGAAGSVAIIFALGALPLLVRPAAHWPLVIAFLRMEAFAVALIAWLHVLSLVKEQLAAERARANTDPLTGLLNRRGIFAAFDIEAERHRRYGHPLSVVLFDVDHFKRINDRHGHSAGDRVLVRVARIVQGVIRPADSLARWGGEEFLLLLPETPLEGAVDLAERLRREIALQGTELGSITASFGVAEFHSSDNLGALVRRADAALYRAKERGRNAVVAQPVESGG
ncbi:MAG: GGDEF domain-containing protein [Armatimonadetes bacterium]|nr:GGDEF domain-containing protein [Armatimonadota bacterium]MDW8154096.1 GGDEF domain-containing protein [Armatimonadota bacterium]